VNSTDSTHVNSPVPEHEPEATAAKTQRKRRVITIGTAAAVIVAAAAVVVPWQIHEASYRTAVVAHAEAAGDFDAVVHEYAAGSDALVDRYELAAVEMDGFLNIVRTVPETVLEPATAMPVFIGAVDEYRAIADVTVSETDETVPAVLEDPLEHKPAPKLSEGLTLEDVEALTVGLRDGRSAYVTATAAGAEKVSQIDDAFGNAVEALDLMMVAGRAWGDRDVFAKDNQEQHDALIATAQALVKPEGESFVDLGDRTAALQAFVAAAGAAQAGHDQTVAAEEEAARQAAAEAERQAAAQRPRNSNGAGNGNPSPRGSEGGHSSKNNNGSTGTVPPGGGRPGGGTNETNGGCWTSNGAGGTMPCGGW
jgi:uncharacterized membrane protein YgcG